MAQEAKIRVRLVADDDGGPGPGRREVGGSGPKLGVFGHRPRPAAARESRGKVAEIVREYERARKDVALGKTSGGAIQRAIGGAARRYGSGALSKFGPAGRATSAAGSIAGRFAAGAGMRGAGMAVAGGVATGAAAVAGAALVVEQVVPLVMASVLEMLDGIIPDFAAKHAQKAVDDMSNQVTDLIAKLQSIMPAISASMERNTARLRLGGGDAELDLLGVFNKERQIGEAQIELKRKFDKEINKDLARKMVQQAKSAWG